MLTYLKISHGLSGIGNGNHHKIRNIELVSSVKLALSNFSTAERLTPAWDVLVVYIPEGEGTE